MPPNHSIDQPWPPCTLWVACTHPRKPVLWEPGKQGSVTNGVHCAGCLARQRAAVSLAGAGGPWAWRQGCRPGAVPGLPAAGRCLVRPVGPRGSRIPCNMAVMGFHGCSAERWQDTVLSMSGALPHVHKYKTVSVERGHPPICLLAENAGGFRVVDWYWDDAHPRRLRAGVVLS